MDLSYLSKAQSNELRQALNLTEEEELVFDRLLKNYTIVKISRECGMSIRTINRKIRRIKDKMHRLAITDWHKIGTNLTLSDS